MASYESKPMQKKSFIKGGEPSIASYDWQDIASGIGYIRFYCWNVEGKNILGNKNPLTDYFFRTDKMMSGSTTSTTWVTIAECNFETSEFNAPRILRGKAYIQFQRAMTGHGGYGLVSFVFTLKAGTKTLGTVTKGTGANGTVAGIMDFLEMDVNGQIPLGTKLTLNVKIRAARHHATSIVAGISFDPFNTAFHETWSWEVVDFQKSTILFIDLPFRIDL